MTNCTPAYTSENTIACRGDLNPAVSRVVAVWHRFSPSAHASPPLCAALQDGVYGLSAFKQRNHVATDSKITRWSDFAKGLTVYAQR